MKQYLRNLQKLLEENKRYNIKLGPDETSSYSSYFAVGWHMNGLYISLVKYQRPINKYWTVRHYIGILVGIQ